MDHERCASPRNYLAYYAWAAAEGYPSAALAGNNATIFTTHVPAAEALRPRLDPSLADFLDTAMLPPADAHDPASLFFWSAGIADPEGHFNNKTSDQFDKLDDALACLYPAIDD
ncbi:hypothetical protein ColTof4_01424 [Colletotrichum tofieldiae]|nr:hypothetical protein ColTof3_08681 [Colletotrichum tofieldiae]GKT69001.1 hypothetical protein ColTof4_01424 [Colletotrichum tofieldiae]GKT96866.1 hypothetical protein Ct61P_14716 [Colletotrichum tofieldiae]